MGSTRTLGCIHARGVSFNLRMMWAPWRGQTSRCCNRRQSAAVVAVVTMVVVFGDLLSPGDCVQHSVDQHGVAQAVPPSMLDSGSVPSHAPPGPPQVRNHRLQYAPTSRPGLAGHPHHWPFAIHSHDEPSTHQRSMPLTHTLSPWTPPPPLAGPSGPSCPFVCASTACSHGVPTRQQTPIVSRRCRRGRGRAAPSTQSWL